MFSSHSPKPQFAPIYLRLPAMPTKSSPTIFCSKDIHIYTPTPTDYKFQRAQGW